MNTPPTSCRSNHLHNHSGTLTHPHHAPHTIRLLWEAVMHDVEHTTDIVSLTSPAQPQWRLNIITSYPTRSDCRAWPSNVTETYTVSTAGPKSWTELMTWSIHYCYYSHGPLYPRLHNQFTTFFARMLSPQISLTCSSQCDHDVDVCFIHVDHFLFKLDRGNCRAKQVIMTNHHSSQHATHLIMWCVSFQQSWFSSMQYFFYKRVTNVTYYIYYVVRNTFTKQVRTIVRTLSTWTISRWLELDAWN